MGQRAVEQATASADEMAAGADGVGQSIAQIASVAELNGGAASEVSASAQTMASQIDGMSEQARALVETCGASYVGLSLLVDQLPGEVRERLLPVAAVVSHDELPPSA